MHRLVRVRGERAERRRDVRRLRVVHVAHAVALADELEPVRHAGERAQRLGDRARRRCRPRARRPSRPRRSRGCARRGSAARPAAGRRPENSIPSRPEPARHDLRARALEDAQLRGAVGLERAVPVEVVGLEVEQHRDVAGERRRRPRAGTTRARRRPSRRRAPTSAACRRSRRPRRRGPAARKIAPSSSVVVVLPFVPVTPTKLRARRQQPVAELDLRPHRDRRARARPRRAARSPGTPGDFTTHVDAVEQREVVLVAERAVDEHDLVAALVSRATARPERASAVDERPQLCGRICG